MFFKNKIVSIMIMVATLLSGFAPLSVSAATYPLSGFAWSDNIGWIALNCANGGANPDDSPKNICGATGTPADWKVKIGASGTSGVSVLTGYAWSDNIGWIKFGGFNSGFPSGAGTTPKDAKLDASGNVTGWVRACSVFSNATTCSGALKADSERGGWDGWISLSGTGYGVTLDNTTTAWCVSNSCPQKKWAWGSAVVGWIDWSGVSLNASPLTVASCGASPTNVDLAANSPVTWTATVSGGTAPYTYTWSGGAPLGGSTNDSATSNSVSVTYTSAGTKNGTIEVWDSKSAFARMDCPNSVTVTDNRCDFSLIASPVSVNMPFVGSSATGKTNISVLANNCDENITLSVSPATIGSANMTYTFYKAGHYNEPSQISKIISSSEYKAGLDLKVAADKIFSGTNSITVTGIGTSIDPNTGSAIKRTRDIPLNPRSLLPGSFEEF